MVNNSTNMNKTNNHSSPQTTEHKQDHDTWRQKSISYILIDCTIFHSEEHRAYVSPRNLEKMDDPNIQYNTASKGKATIKNK